MRIGPRVVRGGAFSLLIVTAGLASTHAVAGTIVVTAVTGSPPLPAAAQIRILERPISATTNAQGRATLSVPAGTYTVRAVSPGTCTADVTAVVGDGATVSIKFTLGPGPCTGVIEGGGGSGSGGSGSGGGNDKVSTGGTQTFLGLVDIRTGTAATPASCENDRLIEGTGGNADLPVNALTLSDPSVPLNCHGAGWIFTADHAPWFNNAAGTFPWTNNGGDVLTVNLPTNRLRIPVTLWLTDFPGKLVFKANLPNGMLKDANTFLYNQHTGLILTNSETADNLPDIVDAGSLLDGATNAPPHPVIGRGCSRATSIKNTPAVYKAQHVNIYVVDGIEDGPSGINCIHFGSPNIAFVDFRRGYENLLHEIGHGLSLYWPNWGHVDGLVGLFPGNLMVSTVVEGTSYHLSLGQLARVHAEASSWLNQPNGVGSVRSRQFPSPFVTSCLCPGDSPSLDCPALQKDITRSGSAFMGSPGRACHMTTIPTSQCVSVAVADTETFTTEAWVDASKSAPGFGLPTIASLATSIATVSLASSTVSSVTVAVTGVSAGTTIALVSLGGIFANVTVKVGSTCP